MEPKRQLEEGLRQLGIDLPGDTTDRLLRLLDELLRWNRTHNLTAITDPAEAVEKHLIDSLTLLPLLAGSERLLDLGSGGGFPGLPLKIAQEGLRIVSVDSVAKKIAFQRHAVRLLGLKGFEPLHERAEELPRLPGFAGGFDIVVSRAFTSLDAFARFALPCLAPDGRIIAMKGAEGEAELDQAQSTLSDLDLTCSDLHRLTLPASGAARTLIVLRRVQ